MGYLLLVAIVIGIGFGIRALRDSRETVHVDTWTGGSGVASVAPPTTLAIPRGGSGAVTRSLGRVEARQLWSSAALLVGLGLSAIVLAFITGISDIIDNDSIFGRSLQHLGLMAYPLAGMTLLALNRATLRSRREGTDELFAATPTGTTTLTGGHLASIATPLVATTVLVGAAIVISTFSPSYPRVGSFGPAWVAEALTAFVLIVGAGALGVALARWLPHGIVAPVALVALLLTTLTINGFRPYTNRIRYISPFATPPAELAPQYMLRPAWPHLLYIVGLVTVVIAIALLRTDRGRACLGVLGAGLVLVVAGGWLQLQPVSTGDAQRIAAMVETPADRCVTRAGVRACSFPGFETWRDDWIDGAAGVLAIAPAVARPARYAAIQTVGNAGISELDPAVREQLGPDVPSTAYGFGGPENTIAWSMTPAQELVGLPTAIRAYDQPCYSGNQARAVVALWLAAAADPDGFDERLFDADAEINGIGATWYRDDAKWALAIWPAVWDTDVDSAVVYARADAAAADQLGARPIASVRRALATEWKRWTNPATTTNELITALGLEPVDTELGARVPPGLQRCP